MTFSMPEIADFKSRAKTISAFGDFSTVDFALLGLGGEPRMVKAGVVSGSFFDVMGLRPVLGRLLNVKDDGPKAAGAAVLTYRFWTTSLNSDRTVIGKTIRLGGAQRHGGRRARAIGSYPAATEIIANVVTSPHHLGAMMVTSRSHRMTELFGRLAPGASLETARAELTAVHDAIMREHPESYAANGQIQLTARKLRDQIAAPARTILLVLLAAAAVVFVIACSNVANLILARSVRREGELAVRAALGAGRGALRRTLLAESLVLCGAGAVLGVVLARPFVAMVSRYAARFSIRALDVPVDASVLWIGAGLALAAAVLLAYSRVCRRHTRRPVSVSRPAAFGSRPAPIGACGCSPPHRLPSHSCCSPAPACCSPRWSRCRRQGPVTTCGTSSPSTCRRRQPDSAARRCSTSIRKRRGGSALCRVWKGSPWGASCRGVMPEASARVSGSGSRATSPPTAKRIRARGFRLVAPRFFAVLGVPLVAGREFTAADRDGGELVSIVSQSVAQRLFPNSDAVNRHMWWTDPYFGERVSRRIVGVVADVDDENVIGQPALTAICRFTRWGLAGACSSAPRAIRTRSCRR